MSSKRLGGGASADLAAFLAGGDLFGLEESPLLAEKTDAFKSYLWCMCAGMTAASLGFGLLFQPTQCMVDQIYEGSYLKMDHEKVEFSQPRPDCCALARTVRSVRLENVTDVTLEDDCCLQMFGLQNVVLQTAGTGGVGDGDRIKGVQAAFLAQPARWKEAIGKAQDLYRAAGGAAGAASLAPAKQAMGAKAAERGTAAALEARLANLDSLQARGGVTADEADSLRVGLLLGDKDHALTLLGLWQLRGDGRLAPADYDTAKARVIALAAAAGEGQGEA